MTKRTAIYFCFALLFAACGQKGTEKASDLVRVKTAKAELLVNNSTREFSFISKPQKETDLSFRVGGPIERFEVYAGNYYKRGEVIAQIDSRDFRIRKERSEALYNQAKAEFARIEVLYEKNNISASAYEKARADYTSAKSAFEMATNELNDTKLIAPFNGYVGEVYIEKYQDVKATQPIISFIDIDQLKIEAYVTQDIAFGSPRPSEVALRFDATPDKVYRARIAEVSKSTTRNNLSYLLTALLPNKEGELPSGMSGKLFFEGAFTAGESLITVPQAALCHRPTEGDYVWVIDIQTQTANKKAVTAGELLPEGKVSIMGGLKADETVAISGLRFLSNNMKVEISK